MVSRPNLVHTGAQIGLCLIHVFNRSMSMMCQFSEDIINEEFVSLHLLIKLLSHSFVLTKNVENPNLLEATQAL